MNRNAVTAAPPETAAPTMHFGAGASIALPPAPVGSPTVDGYHILASLGHGGMGTVWRAVQLSTSREVALKLLNIPFIGRGKAQARFEREVELMAKLEHPNLARVYDSGHESGVYCYAMELVEGVHLDTYAATRRLSKRQICELMRTVCRAVQHAHQRGVIHRDLKPSNILVTDDGEPHVVDFGLAKTLVEDDSEHPITRDGDVAGTPAYMSPEQAAGRVRDIDTRTDVYSLGVILFQLLTGSMPHDTIGTSYERMKRVVEEDARRPRSITRTIDRELEAVLLKALARNPDKRYASAGELAIDLDNYLNGDPLTAKKPTTAYFVAKKLRKHRVPVMSFGSVAIALLVFAGWRYVRSAPIEFTSTPDQAEIYIDGVKEACCTPTVARLGFGRHELLFKPPPGYQEHRRTVEVKWGQVIGAGPVVFKPDFQVILLNSAPEGATVEIRDHATKSLLETVKTPGYVKRLPIGYYEATLRLDGYEPLTEAIQILGSSDPLVIERSLAPLSK